MSRVSPHSPKYRHYKPKGLAVVRLDGKDVYLGKYDSPESWERYHRLVADWMGGRTREPPQNSPSPDHRTINDLVALYRRYAESYYQHEGAPTKELVGMKAAIRPLRKLFGHTQATDFGPKSLKTLRQHLVESGKLCRTEINRRINRVRRLFKWAVAEELVPATTLHALQAVDGLRYGRTTAPESAPVKPVPDEHVERVLNHVSPQISAMIRVQRLCGMRPCEVVMLRKCDIDITGDVWIYEPAAHKNQWRGHSRVIPLGPKAQDILKPYLHREPAAYLFSPRESELQRNTRRRLDRRSPMTPSQRRRKPKSRPKRAKRDRYDVDSYRRAITYGIARYNSSVTVDAEKIPPWSPNQLRHSRATEVRRQYGLDAAQAVLGHARADVTQVYAEKNAQLAIQIARETG